MKFKAEVKIAPGEERRLLETVLNGVANALWNEENKSQFRLDEEQSAVLEKIRARLRTDIDWFLNDRNSQDIYL